MAKASPRGKMSLLDMKGIIIAVSLLLVFFAAGARFGAFLHQDSNAYISGEYPQDTLITVDIKGAVKESGLYHLPPGSRVQDALALVELADAAATELLNSAAYLVDGSELIIPFATAAPDWNALAASRGGSYYGNSSAPDGSTATAVGNIDINTASSQELQKLAGIGPAKADNIIDYRQNYGPFLTIEQIMNVSGIGSATFEKIKENIRVE